VDGETGEVSFDENPGDGPLSIDGPTEPRRDGLLDTNLLMLVLGRQYRYGRAYTIDGNGNLQSVQDVAGNTLTVTATGITGSNGLNVPFLRDGQGRITQITNARETVHVYPSQRQCRFCH